MVTRDVLKSGVNIPVIGTVSVVGIAAGAIVLLGLIRYSKGSRIASRTTKISYRR